MKKPTPQIIICSCPWCPKRECGRRRSNTVTNVAKSRFLESRKNHHLSLLLILLRHIFFKYDVEGVILRSAKTSKNAHFCPLYKFCQGDFGMILPHYPQGTMMLVDRIIRIGLQQNNLVWLEHNSATSLERKTRPWDVRGNNFWRDLFLCNLHKTRSFKPDSIKFELNNMPGKTR